MKALITGGAGFIGSHLAEALLHAGWQVSIIDDLSTGSMENIDVLKSYDQLRYVLDTVMNRPLMLELVDRADIVFHLAAAVGVRLIVEQPVYTIETNIKTTEIVLELCSRKNTPVLITSTSEVYGKLGEPAFNEESDLVLGATTRPRWCYAASKIIDEFLAQAYYNQKKLPTMVVRLFNTIGPRQTGQYGMVVPRFVRQALRNEPITVYGDGSQQRAFTWVGDVVRGIIAIATSSETHGQIFNLGNTTETSILELAQMIKAMTGSSSEIIFIPYDEAYEPGFEDMRRRLPDISKAQQMVGYQPTLNLPDILPQIIEFERGRLQTTG